MIKSYKVTKIHVKQVQTDRHYSLYSFLKAVECVIYHNKAELEELNEEKDGLIVELAKGGKWNGITIIARYKNEELFYRHEKKYAPFDEVLEEVKKKCTNLKRVYEVLSSNDARFYAQLLGVEIVEEGSIFEDFEKLSETESMDNSTSPSSL